MLSYIACQIARDFFDSQCMSSSLYGAIIYDCDFSRPTKCWCLRPKVSLHYNYCGLSGIRWPNLSSSKMILHYRLLMTMKYIHRATRRNCNCGHITTSTLWGNTAYMWLKLNQLVLYYHYHTKKGRACSTSWLEKQLEKIWYMKKLRHCHSTKKFANKSASNTEEWDKVDQHYGETGN